MLFNILMLKKFVKKTKYLISIIVGGYAYFWLITNPLESYTLPIIIYWLPDIIGWHAFFIFLGLLAGLVTLGICVSIEDEKT